MSSKVTKPVLVGGRMFCFPTKSNFFYFGVFRSVCYFKTISAVRRTISDKRGHQLVKFRQRKRTQFSTLKSVQQTFNRPEKRLIHIGLPVHVPFKIKNQTNGNFLSQFKMNLVKPRDHGENCLIRKHLTVIFCLAYDAISLISTSLQKLKPMI